MSEPHTFVPLRIVFLQKLICHWISKVIVFSAGPSSMCAFHFPHENKVRLKLHWGDIFIFNPSEVEASCRRRGRGGKTQYRETRYILDGKNLKSRLMYSISTGMQYNFSSFTTVFIQPFQLVAAGFYT